MGKQPKVQPEPAKPIDWPRADPQTLIGFDPRTKYCTMNCGKALGDPRSWQERRLLCDDCETITPKQMCPNV